MEKQNKNKIINKIIEIGDKYFGKGAVVSLGEETIADVKDWISTGSIILDKTIGKGIPVGKIIEIFGQEATGKSTLGYQILANAQKRGFTTILIDTETSYDSLRAKSLGLNTNELVYVQLNTIEEVFEFIEKTGETVSGESSIVVLWDSYAATPSRLEIEGDFGENYYGIGAKAMSSALRRMKRFLTWEKFTLIIINQVRQNIGVMFGPKWTTPGGEALKFYAAVRLELTIKDKLIKDDKIIGVSVKARTVKNKVATPFRECLFILDFEKGINDILTSINFLIEKGIITENKGWIKYKDKNYRINDLEEYFKQNQEELESLIQESFRL